MAKKISNERKAVYYIGIGLIVIGFLFFISVFLSAFSTFNSPKFGEYTGPKFQNGFIGMIMMIAGSIVANIGARGTAGSGVILDPEKAREDLKPFNEAKGGMVNDMLENVEVLDKFKEHDENKEVIKIKCRECGCLNDEDARFCKRCGKEI